MNTATSDFGTTKVLSFTESENLHVIYFKYKNMLHDISELRTVVVLWDQYLISFMTSNELEGLRPSGSAIIHTIYWWSQLWAVVSTKWISDKTSVRDFIVVVVLYVVVLW